MFDANIYALQEDFGGDGADLYDDVLAVPTSTGNGNGPSITQVDNSQASVAPIDRLDEVESNGGGYSNSMNHIARRHQLYVGNLTWVSVKIRECFLCKDYLT